MLSAKKFFIYALVVSALIISAASTFATPLLAHSTPHAADAVPLASLYVGNSNTGKFHYNDCTLAHRIAVYYRMYFDSREEALAVGYIPCEICKP